MATRKIIIAAFAALLLLTGALNIRSAFGGDPPWAADPTGRSEVDALVGAPVRQPTALDDQIAAMQDALRADETNGRAATLLGQAYLQKARETGDPSDYPKAEDLFRLALDQDEQDFAALVGLGTLALARHHFAEGLEWGERARAINPHYPAAYGVIGDAQIELGRYDDAAGTIQAMVDLRPDLPSFARVSYLRELRGDVAGAIAAMEQAAAGAGIPENVAWAQAQLGNLAFGQGDLGGAEAHYEASLRTLPGSVYGIAGLGKVTAARGDFQRAITHFTNALRTMPTPEFAIALGEIYLAAGQPAEAAAQFALVEAMTDLAQENGTATDVELALFVADHGGDLDEALAWAEAGYAARPSIQSADALAWVRYRAGDLDGAWGASQEALRLGTKDARLHFHAGMIAAARGDTANAIAHLETALAINPHFSVIHAGEARATLEALTS